MKHPKYDYLIIGGGIFGCYTALYLAQKGLKIALIEKEKKLLTKASLVNQARLHSGYHYPRSIATATMSNDNKARFIADHKDFIHFKFEKYYAIDRFSSFTDSRQFERFCAYLHLKCQAIPSHPLFNYDRIAALYQTTEYSFDPVLIGNFYRQQLKANRNITIYTHHRILEAEDLKDSWKIKLINLSNHAGDEHFNGSSSIKPSKVLEAYSVVNATYAASNAIHQLFGLSEIELTHEIAEIAFVSVPQLTHIGLTVMDGQFCSIMPYGLSGLLSLSSVAYTHHKISYDAIPIFDCQQFNPKCSPQFTANCNTCSVRPRSNYRKMLSQIRQYFSSELSWSYFQSYFTIKSKLQVNYIDDGRPTEISLLHQNPHFYCLFAGKVNSIYEIEQQLSTTVKGRRPRVDGQQHTVGI